jgi:glycerate 2-kinase
VRALASPASLKGVLTSIEAASLLATGLRRVEGLSVVECPVADGGEGTADVLHRAHGGEWRTAVVADPLGRPVAARWLLLPDRTAVVESAEAIGLGRLAEDERDPLVATSRGLGELMLATLAARPEALLVCLGGSATVDGGAGLRSVVGRWLREIPIRVACDVRNPLLGERGAARVFGPQKGAGPDEVLELERRLAGMTELRPVATLPGAGAAGGLGAALAALGATLVPGGELVLDLIGFRAVAAGCDLVVTGEGAVDASSAEGKATGAVAAAARSLGVRCVVFGGVIAEPIPDAELRALSGRPDQAAEDLVELGESLGLELVVRGL